MTLVTAVKDYIEVVHKLIETSPHYVIQHSNYGDILNILNFSLSSLKHICSNILTFEWLKQLWYFPILVPELASSMVSEISILDGNFHNMLTFLDQPIIAGNSVDGNLSLPLTCFEKFFTGLVNSLFLWIPTSTATFICFRRFIMQGVEAGFAAALGTMIANIFWLTSLLFGLRCIVVPWISLDLFRYWLGFLLLMKYFWDNRFAYKEVKHNSVFGKNTLKNIFSFHFLLALTEQTSLYPFLSNFSISAQSTLVESFPSENFFDFNLIHLSYLIGISIGSYSIINLICWFWQDPAYRFYFWLMNKFKKLRVADIVRPIHLLFQSITVAFAFSSLPYFGIEYAITNPLGFLPNDQVFHQFKQTSFLIHSTSPTSYRSRLNFPNQKFFRYEDWAEYYHRNIPLDTSLYDQGSYRLFTMEDLNYGTDYEWIRRRSDKIKIRSRLKRLRWFPRNWANRLWEFTKTWSRRNVAWRNDILSTYQYSWDSKTPIVWGKLVREELFPKFQTNDISESNRETTSIQNKTNEKINNNWGSFWGPDPDWASKFLWNQNSSSELEKNFWWNWQSRRNLVDNNNWWKWINNIQNFSSDQSELTKTSTKFFTKQSINNKEINASNIKKKKEYNSDFWKPQDRLISLYVDKSKHEDLTLELSTLRKFARKLTARFKTSQLESNIKSIRIDKKNFEGIALQMLLVVPQIKEWNSFQIVINNINRVLWWSRLTNLNKSNSKKSLLDYNNNFFSNNILLNKQKDSLKNKKPIFLSFNNNEKLLKKISITTPIMDQKSTKNNSNVSSSKEAKIIKFLNGNNKISSINNKILKFKKIQKKLNQLPELAKNLKFETTSFMFTNLPIQNNFGSIKNKNPNLTKKNFTNQRVLNSISNLSKLKKQDITLLHPLNFYLHKEQNFKKKLRFYGVKTIFTDNNQFVNKKTDQIKFSTKEVSKINKTNLSTFLNDSNKTFLSSQNNVSANYNLPIFNFYMKTYFQNYKPTRLYIMNTKMKRQLGVSANARKKGRDYTNKLLKRSKILSGTPWIRQWVNQSGFLARRKRLETWIKRQHYDPNELWSKIMKTDVDLFMSRQPADHFLTNTEEKLLHLRRFLLFEHYDSLRWYTFMSHYRTMTNKIGGTKSFTSKIYNQQFKGTFHKIRHLFSLTPSSSNGSLLKFDQPLYNFENSSLKNTTEESTTNTIKLKDFSQIHEELTNESLIASIPFTRNIIKNQTGNDFIEESTKNLRNSFFQSSSIRQDFIQNLLKQKDFENLTNFLISDQQSNETRKIELQNKKTMNFSNYIVNSRLKEKLRTKFMISLYQKRKKWTKEYEKVSEKLWKKWKLKILWLNRKNKFLSVSEKFNIPYYTSITPATTVQDFPFKQSRIQNNKENKNLVSLDEKKFLSNEKILLQNNLQKVYEIQKLKKLIEFNQENKLDSLFYDMAIDKPSYSVASNEKKLLTKELLNQNSFNDIKKYNKNLEKPTFNDKIYIKAAIKQSLKKAINIQTKIKTHEALPILSLSSSNSLKQLLEFKRMKYTNTLVNIDKNATKKVIKNLYKKALINSDKLKLQEMYSNNKFKHTKGSFLDQFFTVIKSFKPEFNNNKFWNYNLINQINNRNKNFLKTNFEKNTSFKDLKNQNLQRKLILYKKNFLLRERSNIQNYALMKKILLNESSSSLTHHQIRPLPSNRAKTLYEKQSVSDSLSASQTFNLVNKDRILSVLEHKPLLGLIPMNNKIHAYKNRKWLEFHSIKNSNLNFRFKTLKPSKSKDYQINTMSQDLSLLQKMNTTWSLFIKKLQSNIGEIESNQMDLQLQNKFIKNQNLTLVKNNNILNLKDSFHESNILINNKLSGSVFADNLGLVDNIRQKLTKVIQSKQKLANVIEIRNRIRRTKQRRKRQKFSIKRTLLRRHLNRKNRRKLFLKTKEITNQRIVLDRKDEIKERLFFTKIDQINSSIPQFDITKNFEKINTEKFNHNYIPTEQNSGSNSTKSMETEPFYFESKLANPFLKINSQNPTSNLIQIESSENFIDNFIVWLLTNKKTNNLKKENFLNSPEEKIFVQNLFDELNKGNLNDIRVPRNSLIVNSEQALQKNFNSWWKNEKIFNNAKNSNKKESVSFKTSESYLSSLIRTSRYINQIITNQQNNLKLENKTSKFNLNSSYLKFKLNKNVNNENELKNEKNRLRRSLRKSMSNNATTTQKNQWLKKLLNSDFIKNQLFLTNNQYGFSNQKNTRNIFLNNLALSTWVQQYSKFEKPSISQKILSLSVIQPNNFITSQEQELNKLIESKNEYNRDYNNFTKKAHFNLISNNILMENTGNNSTNLIDFNKYIITARTNPSKLSRQQIRKKTLKRRIIRTKRIERLKTLQDHPLKFRADQIQNFYNIQNSLKKWKNFGFISSKLKFNENLWENILEKNKALDQTFIIFLSNPIEKSVENNFSSARYYKPLKSLKVIKTTQKTATTDLIKNQIPENKNSKTSNLNNSEINKNYSKYDIFYKLYSHIFMNNLKFTKSTILFNDNLQAIKRKNLISNQISDLEKSEINFNNPLVKNQQKSLLNINPIPFYAGWDETMRKFVITNRLLSRRDAGYNVNLSLQNPTLSNLNFENNNNVLELRDSNKNVDFTAWPLKGKNSATTLFSQFPFMTSPQTSLSYSSAQILQLKGGTKYQKKLLNEFEPIIKNNKFIDNKWMSASTEKFTITNSENFINFKNEKRLKNQVKLNKNENQDRIRKYGQVISNVTIPAYRKNRRVALFAPLHWRSTKYTTKSILINTAKSIKSQQKLKLHPLFKNKIGKRYLVDKKINSKIILLRTFKQGNRAQTRLPRLNRFLMLKRASGSSWKNKLSSSRRKKRRIKSIQSNNLVDKTLNIKTTNKLIKEGGWDTIRFIIKKRKKRGNNKNPRLRGEKNIRSTKRQLRQKLYLRPKKRTLRRRSLSVQFQNKLIYWRRQSLNISNKINSKNIRQINEISKNNNIKSLKKLNTSILNGRISFTKNLMANSKYPNIITEWNTNRSRQLYRSLFKNPTINISPLYETLPAHSRSTPIIKNLPVPGSSVKTLNRVVKWNSADGSSRFHRVNLAYGWALQLFLNNLQQKIKFKKQWVTNDLNTVVKEKNQPISSNLVSDIENTDQKNLTNILTKQLGNFSSARSFKRRSFKLRQLSYTMSMRLYDRWFYYYYSSKNMPVTKQEQMEKGIQLNLLNNHRFNYSSLDEKSNLFKHFKKFLTFHLNDNQTSFRAYLKNLRIKAKKQADKAIQPTNKLNNANNVELNLSENKSFSNQKIKETLYNFKLFSTSNDENLNLDKKNNDFNSNQMGNKTLLKKEKKLQEDRFFFAQFNRPPLVDDFRITREVNRHYPLNGGFVWPGDYLRLKTIQLPKELIEEKTNNILDNINYLPDFYLQKISSNKKQNSGYNNFYFNSEFKNTITDKKLTTYSNKWNKFELNQFVRMVDKDKLETYNNIKAHAIENKINNLKKIFSNE